MCLVISCLDIWTHTALRALTESCCCTSITNCSERLNSISLELADRHLFLAVFIINAFCECVLHLCL